jgi:unsaturated rhamnogalacturonyl hydrolase
MSDRKSRISHRGSKNMPRSLPCRNRSIIRAALLLAALAALSYAPFGSRAAEPKGAGSKAPAVDGPISTAIGVTRGGKPIPATVHAEDYDFSTKKTRVLLVAGSAGDARSVDAATAALEWFHGDRAAGEHRERFLLSAVTCLNPEARAAGRGPENGSGGDPTRGFPPQGAAYGDPRNPEAACVWRWIGLFGPDLVVVLRPGDKTAWHVPKTDDAALERLAGALGASRGTPYDDGLAAALVRAAAAEIGTVPAVELAIGDGGDSSFVPLLLEAIVKSEFHGPSPARKELERRHARSALQTAKELAKVYGQNLNSVQYIPAMALVGRLWLGELTGDASHRRDVERIVAPFVSGEKPAVPRSGSDLAGHLVFAELARGAKGKDREAYLRLIRAAADLGFDDQRRPLPSMPFHSQMSDAVFMGGPILAAAGRHSSEARYYEACDRHLEFMRKLVLREDGLYRHSPLCEAAWGRGNGFPALGLALCLEDYPGDRPQREERLAEYRRHMAALARHQDASGAWRQVIDDEASFRELTATCMTAFAMTRGVRRGWLEAREHAPRIRRALQAIQIRVGDDGRLIDVCAGTGKQPTLRAYYDRPALLGRDDRGGAMALMALAEIAAWESGEGGTP